MAQRVGRGIALLFHDRSTRRGWVVSSTPRPHFTPGKDPVPILQEVGWAPGPVWTGGKSSPHRDSIPGRPARSQSLYQLRYPAHQILLFIYLLIYWFIHLLYLTNGNCWSMWANWYFTDFSSFHVDFKRCRCPVRWALVANAINSDIDIFNGNSFLIKDLLVSITLTTWFRILKQSLCYWNMEFFDNGAICDTSLVRKRTFSIALKTHKPHYIQHGVHNLHSLVYELMTMEKSLYSLMMCYRILCYWHYMSAMVRTNQDNLKQISSVLTIYDNVAVTSSWSYTV